MKKREEPIYEFFLFKFPYSYLDFAISGNYLLMSFGSTCLTYFFFSSTDFDVFDSMA